MTDKAIVPLGCEREPDFVNPEGTKWWIDANLTAHARNENIAGISLPEMTAWIVCTKDDQWSRLITDSTEIVWEDKTLEGMAMHIDMLKVSKRYDQREAAVRRKD